MKRVKKEFIPGGYVKVIVDGSYQGHFYRKDDILKVVVFTQL